MEDPLDREQQMKPLDLGLETGDEPIPESSQNSRFTRSSAQKYSKENCIFCDAAGSWRKPLHHVSFDAAGSALIRAVEISENDVLRVRLSECITPGDAHAIDVLYHKRCWTLNVVNVLRKTHVKQK